MIKYAIMLECAEGWITRGAPLRHERNWTKITWQVCDTLAEAGHETNKLQINPQMRRIWIEARV